MNQNRKSKKSRKIARYYYEKYNYKKALENYLKAVSYKRGYYYLNEDCYNFIAYCYRELGDYKKSLLYSEKCLEISPGFLEGKRIYAETLILDGQVEKGKKLLA